MDQGISLNALARALKMAKSSVHALAKKGLIPRRPNGKFDLEAVKAALKANVDPARAKAVQAPGSEAVQSRSKPVRRTPHIVNDRDKAKQAVSLVSEVLRAEGHADPDKIDFNAARTAVMILKTQQQQLNLAEQRKHLVPLVKVTAHVERAFIGYRQAIQAMPARHASELAARLGCDARLLQDGLEKMIAATLGDMSKPVVTV